MKKAPNILASLMQMQSKMATIQKEAEAAIFEGSSQGLVTVQMAGTGELKRLTLDPAALKEDAETIEALVLTAVRDAYAKKEAFAKANLAKVSGGLMPLGMKLPGMG